MSIRLDDWDALKTALLNQSILQMQGEVQPYPQNNVFLAIGTFCFLGLLVLTAMRFYGVF